MHYPCRVQTGDGLRAARMRQLELTYTTCPCVIRRESMIMVYARLQNDPHTFFKLSQSRATSDTPIYQHTVVLSFIYIYGIKYIKIT